MTGEHNRDRAVERLLRETRHDRGASPPCVDAESLAAWSDGTLSPVEARRIEAHASRCDRCQSMLAAFARIEPVPAAAAAPFWHRWRLQWLAPAAAMATAFAVWVAVPRDQPPVAMPVPAAVSAEPTAAARPGTAVTGLIGRTAPTDALRTVPPSTAQMPAAPAPLDSAAPLRQEGGSGAARKSEAAVPPVAPASPDQLGSAAAAKDSARRATSDQSAVAQAPPISRDMPAPVVAPSTSMPLSPPAPTETVAGASPPRRANFARSDAASARVPLDIASPDAVHRWRIDSAGQLQHSASAGATWQSVVLATPAALTAGTSPGGSICWVVGANGAVWVTSDGLHFDRRALPEPGDVTSVAATDARHATVVTANGRTFMTTDGGVTWTLPTP